MLINGNKAIGLRNFQLHPERAAKYAGRLVRIWSGEHRTYWRANYSGYTAQRRDAGCYLFQDALDATRHCGPEKRIAFEFIVEGDASGVFARPEAEWTEADGPVVWWVYPIREPAWIGAPIDDNWPGYHTHWTPHPEVPRKPSRGAAA